jgi:hypothetical protein
LDSPDPAFTQAIGVEKVILSEKYKPYDEADMGNDVMLIKLDRPVAFNDAVLPVCMPKPFERLAEGTRCWSTGWGRTGGTLIC